MPLLCPLTSETEWEFLLQLHNLLLRTIFWLYLRIFSQGFQSEVSQFCFENTSIQQDFGKVMKRWIHQKYFIINTIHSCLLLRILPSSNLTIFIRKDGWVGRKRWFAKPKHLKVSWVRIPLGPKWLFFVLCILLL